MKLLTVEIDNKYRMSKACASWGKYVLSKIHQGYWTWDTTFGTSDGLLTPRRWGREDVWEEIFIIQ